MSVIAGVSAIAASRRLGSLTFPEWLLDQNGTIPGKRNLDLLASWTPDQIAQGRLWVETWRAAGADMERVRRAELRGRAFDSRVDDAMEFARAHRVLLLSVGSGVGLDIALAGMPFQESVVQRATVFQYPGRVLLRTCSAEDLILLIAFAARPKDWLDIKAIITRQTGRLDSNQVNADFMPMAGLKGEPDILEELARRRRECEQSTRRLGPPSPCQSDHGPWKSRMPLHQGPFAF